MKKSFDLWILEVDAHLVRKCGLGYLDLADCCYSDWYEDGVSPSSAASKAIRAQNE